MDAEGEPVLLVGWHERADPSPSYAAHHRRMELLRQLLRERLTRNSVPCRTLLMPRPTFEPEAVKRAIAGLPDQGAQVVIACEWDVPDEDFAELVALHRSDTVRTLMITTTTPRGGLPTVLSHQDGVGAEVAHHCLGAGYKRLLYLAPYAEPWSEARAAGVVGAARASGVRVHVEPVGDAPGHFAYLRLTPDAQLARLRICLMRGLAALGRDEDALTAIIACNDRVALDARELLPGFAGGLAGFDDTSAAAHAELTSARQPLSALAERAVALALRLRDGGGVPSITEVPWELVVRGSTRRERGTALVQRLPPPDRRIDNATVAPLQLCPPAVLVGWGRVDQPGETAIAQSARFAEARDLLAAGLQRAGVESATLRIDLLADDDATRRQMDRAARRIVEGGARLAVIQELRLTDEAEALLAAAEAAGNLRVLRLVGGIPPTDQPAVTYDQGAGGALAASHCLRQGYRRMLYLSPSTADWAVERGISARRALLLASGGLSTLLLVPEAGGIPFGEWQHLDHPERAERVSALLDEGLERLLATEAEHSPPAVIASNDTVALELLGVLKARGLRPGIDIGVVGFDDLPRAAQEGLTSLTPPLATMGAEATRIALRMLKGEPVPRRTCLPWVLAPRASTARG